MSTNNLLKLSQKVRKERDIELKNLLHDSNLPIIDRLQNENKLNFIGEKLDDAIYYCFEIQQYRTVFWLVNVFNKDREEFEDMLIDELYNLIEFGTNYQEFYKVFKDHIVYDGIYDDELLLSACKQNDKVLFQWLIDELKIEYDTTILIHCATLSGEIGDYGFMELCIKNIEPMYKKKQTLKDILKRLIDAKDEIGYNYIFKTFDYYIHKGYIYYLLSKSAGDNLTPETRKWLRTRYEL